MRKIQPEHFEPFGTVLGISEGGVKVYSSDYSSVNQKLMPDRSSELARRWLVAD
jgi:hypothetical protein